LRSLPRRCARNAAYLCSLRQACLCALLAALALACELDDGAIPVGTLRMDAGEPAATDASPEDAAADATVPAVARHDSCAFSAPSTLPEPPVVDVDASGRPLFDGYRDLACPDEASVELCPPEVVCVTGSCLSRDRETTGLCQSSGFVARVPAAFGAGKCVAWLTPGELAAACCAELPGFVCEDWPYRRASGRLGLCARHDDCEDGLVCKQLADAEVRVGVCVCPDEEPSVLETGC
jgi:hypothetical protein